MFELSLIIISFFVGFAIGGMMTKARCKGSVLETDPTMEERTKQVIRGDRHERTIARTREDQG